MAEVVLKSGRSVPIDVTNMTVLEWRTFVGPKGSIEAENAVVTKCTGLTAEEINELPFMDLRRIVKAIFKATQEPLADPL